MNLAVERLLLRGGHGRRAFVVLATILYFEFHSLAVAAGVDEILSGSAYLVLVAEQARVALKSQFQYPYHTEQCHRTNASWRCRVALLYRRLPSDIGWCESMCVCVHETLPN